MTRSKNAVVTATASLLHWLNSLKEADLLPCSGAAQVDALAYWNRDSIKRLLADRSVQEAVERAYSRSPVSVDAAQSLQTIKSMLVDACWISRALELKNQSSRGAGAGVPPATRTEHSRDLQAASRKAKQLANAIATLAPVIGRGLTWTHLQTRSLSGNPSGFIANRKGWASATASKEPSVSDLLATLANDLKEESDLLKRAATKNRQKGGAKRRYYPLIDTLFRASISLGVVDHDGVPCPDFQLVYSILMSISPDDKLDESTLRKRWTLQRKRTLKSP